MRAARIDQNHTAVVDALRAVGASVQSLARVGNDCPDLLVGYRGVNYVLEVKTPKGPVKPGQEKWAAQWKGQTAIVRSVDEALVAIRAGARHVRMVKPPRSATVRRIIAEQNRMHSADPRTRIINVEPPDGY